MICCLCPLIAPPPSGPDCRTPGPWGPLPAVSWEDWLTRSSSCQGSETGLVPNPWFLGGGHDEHDKGRLPAKNPSFSMPRRAVLSCSVSGRLPSLHHQAESGSDSAMQIARSSDAAAHRASSLATYRTQDDPARPLRRASSCLCLAPPPGLRQAQPLPFASETRLPLSDAVLYPDGSRKRSGNLEARPGHASSHVAPQK